MLPLFASALLDVGIPPRQSMPKPSTSHAYLRSLLITSPRFLAGCDWSLSCPASISALSFCGAGVLACIVRSRPEAGTTRIDQVILARFLLMPRRRIHHDVRDASPLIA